MFKNYAEHVEEGALEQWNNVIKNEWVVASALLPDVHTGYVLPIGSVVACKDKIVPSFVGYDIGCGVAAVRLNTTKDEIDIDQVFNEIYKKIPVGRNIHKKNKEVPDSLPYTKVVQQGLDNRGYKSMGTLGGGNHFIEVGQDEEGYVWIIVHSGSRNLGHYVAEQYMAKALVENTDTSNFEKDFENNNIEFKKHRPDKFEKAKQSYIQKQINKKTKNIEGIYPLDVDSITGKNYIKDMEYCLEYALMNRKSMINIVMGVLGNPSALMFINRNHNHAEFKEGLWIHRKGATHAEDGMLGVIPGNMRDGSFIVKGKGNPESLCSSSHGAGRVLSRKKAKENLNTEDFKKSMESIKAKVGEETLDESPEAYKNIFEVMDQQKDLVEILHYIKPLVNIKG